MINAHSTHQPIDLEIISGLNWNFLSVSFVSFRFLLYRFDGPPFAGPANALRLYELLSLVVEIDWIPHLIPSLLLLLRCCCCLCLGKEIRRGERDTQTLGWFDLVLIWMKRRELYELIIFAGSLEIVWGDFIPSFCVFRHCCAGTPHTALGGRLLFINEEFCPPEQVLLLLARSLARAGWPTTHQKLGRKSDSFSLSLVLLLLYWI